MTSEFSTQRTQTKDRKNHGDNTDRGAMSMKSVEESNKKETPLPTRLDNAEGQNGNAN